MRFRLLTGRAAHAARMTARAVTMAVMLAATMAVMLPHTAAAQSPDDGRPPPPGFRPPPPPPGFRPPPPPPPAYDRGRDYDRRDRDYDRRDRDYDRRDRGYDRRDWDRDYDRRGRDYDRRDRDYDRGRDSRGGGPRGSVCVTSRGSCPTGVMLPRNAPCQCNIPGFGVKRGAVAY
ncbi:hypothetical protein ACERNI_12150 [Camelimonas sp. ID_303_24]